MPSVNVSTILETTLTGDIATVIVKYCNREYEGRLEDNRYTFTGPNKTILYWDELPLGVLAHMHTRFRELLGARCPAFGPRLDLFIALTDREAVSKVARDRGPDTSVVLFRRRPIEGAGFEYRAHRLPYDDIAGRIDGFDGEVEYAKSFRLAGETFISLH